MEYQGLRAQGEGGWVRRVAGAWQAGRLSNLDYLLYLNLAAGRSFCDLAQWPVAPWVLADYRSPALDLSDPRSVPPLRSGLPPLPPARTHAIFCRILAPSPRSPPHSPVLQMCFGSPSSRVRHIGSPPQGFTGAAPVT